MRTMTILGFMFIKSWWQIAGRTAAAEAKKKKTRENKESLKLRTSHRYALDAPDGADGCCVRFTGFALARYICEFFGAFDRNILFH